MWLHLACRPERIDRTNVTLVVAPCSFAAAANAVKQWHYSQRMPVGKCVRFGVWEDDRFIGAVVFSWGANHNLARSFGVDMTQCAELVRVAMRQHATPVSQVVAQCLRKLKAGSPGLRVIVSFADPAQGHVGSIYQAGNWTYLGTSTAKRDLILGGVTLNRRAYTGRQFKINPRQLPPAGARWVATEGKHRYAYPLDHAMRRQLVAIAQPYPRGRRLEGEPPSFHDGGSGSIPDDRSTTLTEAPRKAPARQRRPARYVGATIPDRST